jgi:hypothetical protein
MCVCVCVYIYTYIYIYKLPQLVISAFISSLRRPLSYMHIRTHAFVNVFTSDMQRFAVTGDTRQRKKELTHTHIQTYTYICMAGILISYMFVLQYLGAHVRTYVCMYVFMYELHVCFAVIGDTCQPNQQLCDCRRGMLSSFKGYYGSKCVLSELVYAHVCVCVFMCVYVCVCVCVCGMLSSFKGYCGSTCVLSELVYAHVCMCMCVCVYLCVRVSLWNGISIQALLYQYVCVCVCVCINTCVCVCMNTCVVCALLCAITCMYT